jgi:peptidyl-prolyl cis-trans isomerase A (cyclophilin A)
MKKVIPSFCLLLLTLLLTIHFISVDSQAQSPRLNVEPENPPGYVPPTPEQIQQQLLQQLQLKQAAGQIPGQAPVDSQSTKFPPPAAPPTNFQSPTDLSNAIPNSQPNSNDPNFTTPADGPFYPPANEVKKSPEPNQIIEVKKKLAVKKIFAKVYTTMGSFKFRLYSEYAPRTVKNFTDLATGQKEFVEAFTSKKSTRPFYNGQSIFKVVRNFVVQMGCPFGDGRGGPGYEISDEFTPYLHHNKPGMVSMANHGPNTAGSQFFITLNAQPSFDDNYTIFGEVVEGMSIVEKISKVRVGPTSRPLKRIVIQKIEIE